MKAFWELCECWSRRIAVYKEWVEVGGDDWELIRQLILPTSDHAASYPNPCPHGLRMKIIHHVNGKIVAIDEDDPENRIELTQQDIIFYKLDLCKLRRMLCHALSEVRISKNRIEDDANVIRIGNYEPKISVSYPVYLMFSHRHNVLQDQIILLQLKRRCNGAILLTPSRMNWTDDIEIIARNQQMLLVPLDEVVIPSKQAFAATDAWPDYLNAFMQLVGVEHPSQSNQSQKPLPMRATRAASIEKLEKLLEAHLIAARDYAYALQNQGREPMLLPRPTQKHLALMLDCDPSVINRCLKDPRARVLRVLWQTAGSLEELMNY